MPYFLSDLIRPGSAGLWHEGPAYETKSIYSLSDPSPAPPVNYAEHLLRPHSLAHIDAPGHIVAGGKTISDFFVESNMAPFFGLVTVVKFPGNGFKDTRINGTDNQPVRHWEVSLDELTEAIGSLRPKGDTLPNKLLISPEVCRLTTDGLHDPNDAFTLSESAAELLTKNRLFNHFGTSWKSTDYQPGRRERPVHRILFRSALISECLKLSHVPAGRYFLCAFPLPLMNATESPVSPVLFTREEVSGIKWDF